MTSPFPSPLQAFTLGLIVPLAVLMKALVFDVESPRGPVADVGEEVGGAEAEALSLRFVVAEGEEGERLVLSLVGREGEVGGDAAEDGFRDGSWNETFLPNDTCFEELLLIPVPNPALAIGGPRFDPAGEGRNILEENPTSIFGEGINTSSASPCPTILSSSSSSGGTALPGGANPFDGTLWNGLVLSVDVEGKPEAILTCCIGDVESPGPVAADGEDDSLILDCMLELLAGGALEYL